MPSNYTAVDQFNTPKIYDISDKVEGAIGGDANIPIKIFADADLWLKNRAGRYHSEVNLTGNTTISATHLYKFINLVVTSANIVIQLPPLSAFAIGDKLKFKAKCTSILYANIKADGSEKIIFNSGLQHTETWMYDGEALELVVTAAGWEVSSCKGNFESVGEPLDGYIIHKNCLIRNGSTLNRVDYPRLWWWISNNLADGQQLIALVVWNAYPYTFRGCFHKGDTVSTFGIPDDRGMFTRYLDLGRGVSSGRTHNYPGGYEEDAFKAHTHGLPGTSTGTNGINALKFDGNRNATAQTESTGTDETRSKNNAKIPLLRY